MYQAFSRLSGRFKGHVCGQENGAGDGLGTRLHSTKAVVSTTQHPGSRGVADIMSVTMPLLSIKDLAVAISTRAGPAEDDPPLFVREREELLIELFGRCERTNIGIIIAPPTGILFQSFLCYVIIIMFLLPCAAKDRSTIHIAIAGKVES